jgi:hypothetical protein
VSSTSAKLNAVKPNETLYFKIRAYRTIWFTKVYGTLSSPITGKSLVAASVNSTKIKLSTVSGLKVDATSIASISLSWTAVKDASAYDILRSSTLNGKYVKIAASSTPKVTASGLSFNTIYYFKVTATTTSGKVVIASASSKAISGKTLPAKVDLTVKPASSSSNTLSWPAVGGASGYEVYFYTGTRYNQVMKTVTTNSFIHASLKSGVKVIYSVRAYKLSGKTKIYGPYSNTITSAPDFSKAELLVTTNKQLVSLIAKVNSKAGKAVLLRIKSGLDQVISNPKYDPRSDVNAAWQLYDKLSNKDKTDIIVKGSLTMNLSTVNKLKALYGY